MTGRIKADREMLSGLYMRLRVSINVKLAT